MFSRIMFILKTILDNLKSAGIEDQFMKIWPKKKQNG